MKPDWESIRAEYEAGKNQTGTLTAFLESYKATRSIFKAEKDSGYILSRSYPAAGFYVYALVDPRDDSIFYVGKGIGGRVLKHEERTRRGVMQNKAKVKKILEIFNSGHEALKLILFASESEDMALGVEDETIHELRDFGLTNIIGGSMILSPKVRSFADCMREKVQAFRTTLVTVDG